MMMRKCDEHGYYRGDRCPECDEKGQFVMNDGEMDTLSRTLAGILRHFPERFDLYMDDQGWIDLIELVDAIKDKQRGFHWLAPKHIKAIMDTDDKGRYQLEDGLVRATYGHSLDLDLDLPTENIPSQLYYPTTEEEVDIILETGLHPSDRSYVHLSKTYEKAMEAGRVRVDHPIILVVDAEKAIEDGFEIMEAGTSVYITENVPSEYLKKADVKEIPPEEEMVGEEDEEESSQEDDE